MHPAKIRYLVFAGLGLMFAGLVAAAERNPDSDALVQTLRKGGCYIVMRHASSPRNAPAPGEEVAGNTARERQLDAQGKETAHAMGESLRRLGIPIGAVLSSPTWRAQETVQEARLPRPTLVQELGDGGQSMSAANNAQTAWLLQLVTHPIEKGNTVVISHFPNLRAAFPEFAANLADGEAMILKPGPNGEVKLLRRVRIEEWPSFGAAPAH
jgi:phosphohistidine phosphatase SixA